MKVVKCLAVLCLAMLLLTSAVAEGLDYSSMTDEELQAVIDSASKELKSRHADSGVSLLNGGLILDQDGVVITLTGNRDEYGSYCDLEAVVENSTDHMIYVSPENASINGWEVFMTGIYEVGSGKKKKGSFTISLGDAEISSLTEVEVMEMVLLIGDNESYKTLFETDVITLVP